MYIMQKHKIDLVVLQETKVSNNSEEIKILPGTNDKYIFRFSSKANNTQQLQQQPHAKAAAHKAAAKSGRTSRLVEHHGVGFVIGPNISKAVKDCTPYTNHLMELVLHNHGPDIHIINHYTPHSGKTQEEKTHHWDILQDLILNKPQNLPTYVLGDSNARLYGYTCDLEQRCIGRFIFGHGAQHVYTLPKEQRDNYQYLIDFCAITASLVINTMFLKPDCQK